MRLTGGEWGGRILKTPAGQNTRPTSDANREALFNILSHSFGHSMNNVVDFYAGSGALSFEALSRGASKAMFIEKDKVAQKCILQNCEILKISSQDYRLLNHPKPEEWLRYLEEQAQAWGAFDTIFCDPPYSKGLADRALKKILQSCCVSEKALIYVELAKEEDSPVLEGWNCEQRRDRGASAQCFYKRQKS